MSWHAKRYDSERRPDGTIPRWRPESTHHRKPTSIGGTNKDSNLSELSVSKHRAWHTLFQNWTPVRIAQDINDRYLDPEWELVSVKRTPDTIH